MIRHKLKHGGSTRRKALLGADGAVMAAATLTAAGMNVAATIKSANSQAKAVENSAKTQAQSIKDQTKNNNALQQESLAFSRQQNQENRQQQQEIQTTLQMLAGQENMNDRLEASKVQVKYGGKPKKLNNMQPLFYGGGNRPFTVTDGGGVIPLQTDANGYGLYELYGNDHEHYHKTKSGKQKSGVGIKFKDGSVVEGEGNEKTPKGEKFYVTPTRALFIAKNPIAGFNPGDAVDNGMHPVKAFNIQQILKIVKGVNDDGSKMTEKDRRKALYGFAIDNILDQYNQPDFSTGNTAAGVAYAINNIQPQTTVAKFGGRRKFKDGGFWQNHAGATYAGIGNIVGAGLNILGSQIAGRKMAKAYINAGNILADAYNQMKGIDLSSISREDYTPGHVMAVVRSANTNINPQLERIRRNADNETRNINRNTLSSAARQQRLSGVNDRMMQSMNEQYAYKDNLDEKIKQENASRIQEASAQNAQLDAQARQAYGKDRLSLMQYNNNIENAKIAGRAQALSDATVQSAMSRSNAFSEGMNAIGSAITGTAQGFANSISAQKKAEQDFMNVMLGADTSTKIDYLTSKDINDMTDSDKALALSIYNRIKDIDDPVQKANAAALKNKFGFV